MLYQSQSSAPGVSLWVIFGMGTVRLATKSNCYPHVTRAANGMAAKVWVVIFMHFVYSGFCEAAINITGS